MPIKKIENLIDGNGFISTGSNELIRSAADEDPCFFAKLETFEGESLMDLLRRLDAAIDEAYEEQVIAEEVNS